MDSALYFPIHRAKRGEIVAIGHLSPETRTRVRLTLDIPKPTVIAQEIVDDLEAALEQFRKIANGLGPTADAG